MFLRRPDDNQTWLAEGQVDVQRTAPLWLRGEAFDLPQASVRRVSVQHPGQAPLVVERATSDQPFTLAPLTSKQIPAGRSARASGIAAVAYGLQRLPLQNVFKPAEVAADWGQATVSVFDTFDGLTVTASVLLLNGVPHVRLAAAVAADASDQQRAAAAPRAEAINQQVADWVFVIPPHTAATFTPKLDDLLEPLAPPAAPSDGPPGPPGPPPGMSMPGMRPPGM